MHERSMPTSFGSHSRICSSQVSSRNIVAVQLARLGDHRVVGVEFDLDVLVGDELLDPGHLLDLEADRVAVLEQERDDRAETTRGGAA